MALILAKDCTGRFDPKVGPPKGVKLWTSVAAPVPVGYFVLGSTHLALAAKVSGHDWVISEQDLRDWEIAGKPYQSDTPLIDLVEKQEEQPSLVQDIYKDAPRAEGCPFEWL